MASLRFHNLFIFLLLIFVEIVQQVYSIKGPKHIKASVGKDVWFMWNETDQKVILSVSWGIRKGNIPDPQFISVNKYDGRVKINEDIGDTLKRRVEFIGNLTIGRAWFVLKNLTVNDTNEYIASISADVSVVLPYYVHLIVTEEKEKPTEGPSPTPDTTAAAPNNTKKPTEGHSPTPDTTAAAPNITPTPKPNSSNILRHTKGYMILMAIALEMWHSYF